MLIYGENIDFADIFLLTMYIVWEQQQLMSQCDYSSHFKSFSIIVVRETEMQDPDSTALDMLHVFSGTQI